MLEGIKQAEEFIVASACLGLVSVSLLLSDGFPGAVLSSCPLEGSEKQTSAAIILLHYLHINFYRQTLLLGLYVGYTPVTLVEALYTL